MTDLAGPETETQRTFKDRTLKSEAPSEPLNDNQNRWELESGKKEDVVPSVRIIRKGVDPTAIKRRDTAVSGIEIGFTATCHDQHVWSDFEVRPFILESGQDELFAHRWSKTLGWTQQVDGWYQMVASGSGGLTDRVLYTETEPTGSLGFLVICQFPALPQLVTGRLSIQVHRSTRPGRFG